MTHSVLITFLQLFPIYNELKTNNQVRMNTVIGGSIGAATLTYEVIAAFGYLTFGSNVRLEGTREIGRLI